jgi:hypothetical protein
MDELLCPHNCTMNGYEAVKVLITLVISTTQSLMSCQVALQMPIPQ